jgi:shikimate kinase
MTSRLPQMQAVVLVGFMGAGKSSVGPLLAQHLGWTFEDLDHRIERREKQTVAEIFRNAGEAGFRRAERIALKELIDGLHGGVGKVIALGGGAFVQDSNVSLIEEASLPTVFLDATVDELWQRCQRQTEELGLERPLLGNVQTFRELYESRRPHYSKASLRQETGGKSVDAIVAELIQGLGMLRSAK